ncbi:MAG: ABC transporter ATP-binding protein [Carbonactinosporaceae bacterium]
MSRHDQGAVAVAPQSDGAAERAVAVSLRGVWKVFGQVDAVAGVDLDVYDGEFFAMLGPSGSGKTTVLRVIAGFETPTKGSVSLEGRDVTRFAPFERDVNTVFQDYALFPHMNVLANIEYGLKVKKVPKSERTERARDALRTVRLEGLDRRRPGELSGGQRQRVALARALVNRPKVLLLDEPLGALDLKLREEMQIELKAIQRQVGITFLYVTHDQEEALTMSDRVAVFNHGRIEQVGAPAAVYERPASPFVAGFVGISNLIRGDTARAILGREGTYSVRPEKIRVITDPDAADGAGPEERTAAGRVADVVYAGPATRFVVELDAGGRLIALQQNLRASSLDVSHYRDARVRLVWHRQHEFDVVPARSTHELTEAARP